MFSKFNKLYCWTWTRKHASALKKTDCRFEASCVNERDLCLARPEEAVRKGVYSPQDLYTFPATRLGQSSTLKVNIRNNSSDTHEVSRGCTRATAPEGNAQTFLVSLSLSPSFAFNVLVQLEVKYGVLKSPPADSIPQDINCLQ